MPKIYYSASNYHNPFDYINTTSEQFLYCRKLDLYRAIITVGSPSFITWSEIRANGLWRTISNSIFTKIQLVNINIESTPNGMNLHRIFDSHVTDQKRIISYNLGMAFAKFYSEKLLNIPNLIHLENLKKAGAVEFINSNNRPKEPDLAGIGRDHNWHIFEAKGMSLDRLSVEVKRAKHQGLQVKKIQGQTPATVSACATYLGKNKITSLIEDPQPIGEKEIKINEKLFYEWYYKSFFALNEYFQTEPKNGEFKGVKYKFYNVNLKDIQLEIGLEAEIYNIVLKKQFNLLPEYYSNRGNLDAINSGAKSEEISIGLDGFIVRYGNF